MEIIKKHLRNNIIKVDIGLEYNENNETWKEPHKITCNASHSVREIIKGYS